MRAKTVLLEEGPPAPDVLNSGSPSNTGYDSYCYEGGRALGLGSTRERTVYCDEPRQLSFVADLS